MIKFPEDINTEFKILIALSAVGFVASIIWSVKLLYFVFNHVTITIN